MNLILPKQIYKWALSNCNDGMSIQTFIIKVLEQDMKRSDNSRYIKDYEDEQTDKSENKQ